MDRRGAAWAGIVLLFVGLYVGIPAFGLLIDRLAGVRVLPDVVRGSGAPVVALGATGLLWSIALFVRVGRGTPNPAFPPRSLVTTGPFAWTRNPIIGSHFLILVGMALLFGSPSAILVTVLLGVPARSLVLHEEKTLESRFGEAYRAYRARVPRWIPRPPRRPTG